MAEESITAEALDALAARLDEVEVYLHLDEKRERAAELERQSAQPGFWDDAEHARAIMAELSAARDDVKAVEDARAELADARAALELAGEMGDDPEAAGLVAEAASTAEVLDRSIDQLELTSWFTGEFDHGDAIVTIKPGQGVP